MPNEEFNKIIIGIAGGSGVGKTTLIDLLKQRFSGLITTFSLDNYYLPKDQQIRDENGVINFDLPTALDTEKMRADFALLRSGRSITQLQYTFNNPNITAEEITIIPSSVFIVEGLFTFYYDFLKKEIDYSVFIDVELDRQLERRLRRDVESRNYSREDVMYQWNNHVVPAYRQFVLPFRESSDLILNNNEDFRKELAPLYNIIDEKMGM